MKLEWTAESTRFSVYPKGELEIAIVKTSTPRILKSISEGIAHRGHFVHRLEHKTFNVFWASNAKQHDVDDFGRVVSVSVHEIIS
jgi:hypothetical protein